MLLKHLKGAACAFAIVLCAGISLVNAQTTPATPAPAPAASPAPAAPADAGTPAGLPTPGSAITTNVENPYGLKALWEQGDIVAKTTLSILFIMSLGSWYIIFTKL